MRLIRTSMFILFLALIVASASATGNGPSLKIAKIEGVSVASVPLGYDTWSPFNWGSGVPAAADPTFEFSSAVPSRVIVTDGYNPGDQFRVSDNLGVLGVTSTPSAPVAFPPFWTEDPNEALAQCEYSRGCFDLAPGDHEISIEAIQNPWDYGHGFLRIEEGTCPAEIPCEYYPTPAPEFPSVALPAAMILGFLGVVLFIQGAKKQ